VVRTLEVRAAALRAAAAEGFTGATDLAEALVLANGLDYRSAYQVVARAVAAADDGGEPLTPARLAEAAGEVLGRPLAVDPAVVAAALDPDRVVADARQQPGGSAPERVREHAAAVRAEAAAAARWERERRAAATAAVDRLLTTARRLTGEG
jgi:argininosuccinate lyase